MRGQVGSPLNQRTCGSHLRGHGGVTSESEDMRGSPLSERAGGQAEVSGDLGDGHRGQRQIPLFRGRDNICFLYIQIHCPYCLLCLIECAE